MRNFCAIVLQWVFSLLDIYKFKRSKWNHCLVFFLDVFENESNQIFYSTRYIMPKRVTSLLGPAFVKAPEQHGSFQRNIATMVSRWQPCPIWPTRDLNLRPPASETNALPLDHMKWMLITKIFDFRSFFIFHSNAYFADKLGGMQLHCII